MKKLFIALVALIGIGIAANAQKTEFQFGYGGYTAMDACDYHDGRGPVKSAWGALTAGVNFKVAPSFWLGPSYTFSSSSFKHHHSDIYYHVIMLNGRYEYYRTANVTLYGHVGMGVDFSHITYPDADSDTKAYFAYQISPIGANVPLSRSFSLFGELGFGAQGLLQVGGRIKF